MYRNQYLITSNGKDTFHSLVPFKFCGLNVFCHPSLHNQQSHNVKFFLLLLGYAFDPQHPEYSNQLIAEKLLEYCGDSTRLFKEVEFLTGRFVALVGEVTAGAPSLKMVFGDACSFKQMYYGHYNRSFYITSSIKMFYDYSGNTCEVRPDKKQFMDHRLYAWNECGWYCDEEVDDSLKKLLPNHYYDHNLGKAVRMPLYSSQNRVEYSEIYESCSSILKGSYKALLRRYNPLQPITAGMDSRMLLASVKEFIGDIQFYLFDFERDPNDPDIQIASRIARDHHLNFRILTVEDLTESFKEEFSQEHLFPRFLAMTKGIQYHYVHHRHQNKINVNGGCGEILRCYLGYSRQTIPRSKIYYYTRYSKKFPFLKDAVEHWYDSAVIAAKENNISVLDLFYWELKMGTWGAQYSFDQDLAIEEYSPFNNKHLILTFMQLPAEMRKKPALKAPKEWVEYMWSGLMNYEINPSSSFVRKWIFDAIYSDSRLLYYFFRYRHLLD